MSFLFSIHGILNCGTFEDQSSICFDYLSNDDVLVHNFNQSSNITTALASVIDVVNGNYCRDKVMEFLCKYFFPQCDNDTDIIPICKQSCSEYLMTGVCANHLLNVLTLLNAEDYLNMSVDGLLHDDCSPLYNLTVSDSCTLLKGVYIHCNCILV